MEKGPTDYIKRSKKRDTTNAKEKASLKIAEENISIAPQMKIDEEEFKLELDYDGPKVSAFERGW